LTAVKETARKAITMASELINLAEEDKRIIQKIGRSSGSALPVREAFLQRPIISIPKICEITGLWTTSVTTVIKHFEQFGSLFTDYILPAEVNIIGCDIAYAFMITTGIIPVNKPPDFLFQLIRRLPDLQQDTFLVHTT
jgi:hypothetical protein